MAAHPQLIELLDAAKERAGLTSDLQLDRAVGRKNQVTRWRSGFTVPSKDQAVILAEMAGREPEAVLNLIGYIEAERASQPKAAAVYRSILARMAVTLSLPLVIALSPEKPAQAAVPAEAGMAGPIHIMERLRRWLRALFPRSLAPA